MRHPVTTAHYNQSVEDYQPLHAADLDVWVAYDGGTVIVRPGSSSSSGHDADADITAESQNTPFGAPSPVETESITVPAVMTGIGAVDRSPTIDLTLSVTLATSPSSSSSSTELLTTDLPTLISESQAPSSTSLMATSEMEPVATSNIMSSSSPFGILSSTSLTTSSPSTTTESTPTVTAPPTPSSSSSNYLSHSPPYYVAIVLGVIAGVAFLASLTAWALRRQAHVRHRRLVDSAAKLPWVSSGGGNDDSDGRMGNNSSDSDIENAMRTTPTEMGIMNLGSREDMAYVQSWEPRGDRDVGEPKRSESCVVVDRKPRPPFINQHIPSYALFSRHSAQQYINTTDTFSCANRVSSGSIDPHLQVETLGNGSILLITNQVPGDISVSSSQEVGFPCPSRDSMSPLSEVGTPRELVPMPRFLGLDGKGLSVPWEEKVLPSNEGSHTTTKTKPRIISAEYIRRAWERQTSEHSLGSRTGEEQEREREGWANSIKSNFVNAFNAVAASLPIAAIRDGKEGPGSNFTPARPKQSSKRNGPRHLSLGEDEAKSKLTLSRGCSVKTSVSDPWSLVATGSNTGVVHIRLPTTSDICSVSSHDLPDPGFGLSRAYTLQTTKPLQVEKKSSTLLFTGRTSISSQGSKTQALLPYSRTSSAGGGGSVSPKRHRKSPSGSMKRKITLDRRSGPLFSRTTSLASSSLYSTHSTVSVVTGAEDVKERRLVAREALKDRRRKAKRLNSVVHVS